MQSAIVLGGGMVGVSTALHLQRRGWSVTLVDRKEPGRETSYGNAGIIQSEAVRPYPMPRDLATLAQDRDGPHQRRALPPGGAAATRRSAAALLVALDAGAAPRSHRRLGAPDRLRHGRSTTR